MAVTVRTPFLIFPSLGHMKYALNGLHAESLPTLDDYYEHCLADQIEIDRGFTRARGVHRDSVTTHWGIYGWYLLDKSYKL